MGTIAATSFWRTGAETYPVPSRDSTKFPTIVHREEKTVQIPQTVVISELKASQWLPSHSQYRNTGGLAVQAGLQIQLYVLISTKYNA